MEIDGIGPTRAVATGHGVVAVTHAIDEGVGAVAAGERVVAEAAGDDVVITVAAERVVILRSSALSTLRVA
jgi:tRNA threonylcarbamoyladenosine modification (KEOPS) complex  Pcc1 subunit